MNPGMFARSFTTLTAAVVLGAGLLVQTPDSFAQSANPGTQPGSSTTPTAQPEPQLPAARELLPHSDAQIEAHLKRLHDQLKITAAETDQWNALAQVIRDNEHRISSLIQQRRKNTKAMTAVDNLRGYEEITEAHADGLKKLVPVFEKLYGQMSDAQKKTADSVFNQRGRARAAAQSKTAPAKPSNS
jgi:hypothetical protein